MTPWRAAASRLSAAAAAAESHLLSRGFPNPPLLQPHLLSRSFSRSAAAAPTATSKAPPAATPAASPKPEIRLSAMFLSKPCSLALPPDSPLRVEEPHYEGFRRVMLTLLLFYSKQSKSIRGANVVYHRIISQVDKPAIYDVFQLEKTFKTTFSLLVLHMWLILRRLKEEGKEGVKFGQYIYEVYNHDVELRVSKAGVNLLLITWMKELERIFYGNIVKYDTAISPEAKQDDLVNVVWRNVFAEEGSDVMDAAAAPAVQALARYTRRESTCLSLTDKEAIFSGNFKFSSLSLHTPSPRKPAW